jgi:hypothetical protein
MNMFFCGLL